MFMCLSIFLSHVYTRKFQVKRDNDKVDSIETGRIVIAHLFP